MQTLRDKVRAICHDLRLRPLTGVEGGVLKDIVSRIRHLPSAEAISSMPREDLPELRARAERLIFDIDKAGNRRTTGYATRHVVDKGIPPRRAPVVEGAVRAGWYKRALSSREEARNADSDQVQELRPHLRE